MINHCQNHIKKKKKENYGYFKKNIAELQLHRDLPQH